MQVRESGMPEEAYWESLFDIPLILDTLGIHPGLSNVVEVGCGYGSFTLPVAARLSGILTAIDIDPAMAQRTRERAAAHGLTNIRTLVQDVEDQGLGVPPASQDAVLLFNILHGERPVEMLRTAAKALRPSGKVCVIHWRYDPSTPRGPDMAIRPRPESIADWARATGQLRPAGDVIDLPPWHYGLIFRRPDR